MYTNVSETFLTKLSEPSRHFAIRLKEGNTVLPIDIVSGSVVTGTCGNKELSVGCAFAASAKLVIRRTGIPLEGREVFAEIGLLLDDGTYEYVPFGYWTIQKPNTQTDGISFTAVDRIASKFGDEYKTSLTYPAKISDILSELATATGTTITCSLQTSQQISKAITGVTNRGALALIAATLLGNAWCDRNGTVRITSYKTATNVPVEFKYVKPQPTMDEIESEIKGVRVFTSEDRKDEYISYGDGHMISVTDIYMTESVLQTVSTNLVGLKYNGGSVSFMGNPLIDPSDMISFVGGTSAERNSYLVTHADEDIITDGEDRFIVDNYSTYYVPCMELTQAFDGGLTSTVIAPGSFEKTSKTYATGAITAALERQAISTAVAQETADVAQQSADVAQESADAAQETADAAVEAASRAQSTADSAVTLANGKNKIYYQGSAPTSGMRVGDLWFDTDGGNAIYEYKSTGWVLHQLAQGAIAANSITGNEIVGNTITANHIVSRTITGEEIAVGTITATNITGDSLSAIYADLGTITAGVIRSTDYRYTSGHYTSAGFIIDVDKQIIRGEHFSIEDGVLYGNSVHLTGEINAETGSIKGNLVTSGINAANITTGYLNADRIDAHTISVTKLTGSMSGGLSNSWGIDFAKGTLTIGNISAENIKAGYISADRIEGNSIAVSKLTGSIKDSGNTWEINLTYGTMKIGNLSADNITTGTLKASLIAAGSIASDKLEAETLSAIRANLGTIKAGVLQSANYSYSSGDYTTNGMIIDLNNNMLRTPFLYITGSASSGSLKMKGDITATRGKIGCLTITEDANMYLYTGQHSAWNSTTAGIFISAGTYSLSVGSGGKFYVKNDGTVTCGESISISSSYGVAESNAARVVFLYNSGEKARLYTSGTGSFTMKLNSTSVSFLIKMGNDTKYQFGNTTLTTTGITDITLGANNVYTNAKINFTNYYFTLNYGVISTTAGIRAGYRDTSQSSVVYKTAWLIQITSNGTMTTGATYVEGGSDRRLKNVIETTPDDETLYVLRETELQDFTYKNDERKLRHTGVIAQQLRDVMIKHNIGYRPYFIINKNEGVKEDINCRDLNAPEDKVTYSVGYSNFIPIIWKGWQIHDNELQTIKQQVLELKSENERLKNEIKAMREAV